VKKNWSHELKLASTTTNQNYQGENWTVNHWHSSHKRYCYTTRTVPLTNSAFYSNHVKRSSFLATSKKETQLWTQSHFNWCLSVSMLQCLFVWGCGMLQHILCNLPGLDQCWTQHLTLEKCCNNKCYRLTNNYNNVKNVSVTLWFCLQRHCKMFCCIGQTVCAWTMDVEFVCDCKIKLNHIKSKLSVSQYLFCHQRQKHCLSQFCH